MYKHARCRIKEIDRVVRIHRDPFEQILSVLEALSPVGEYRKITEEILRCMRDERYHPRSTAEAVRAFLLASDRSTHGSASEELARAPAL